MNKSKFLKKSLAALLAILMVAAMIPLSAAAVTVDFAGPNKEDTIKIVSSYGDLTQDTADDDSNWTVTLPYNQGTAATIEVSTKRTGTYSIWTSVNGGELVESEGVTAGRVEVKDVTVASPKTATIVLRPVVAEGEEAQEDITYNFTVVKTPTSNDPTIDTAKYTFTDGGSVSRTIDGVVVDKTITFSVPWGCVPANNTDVSSAVALTLVKQPATLSKTWTNVDANGKATVTVVAQDGTTSKIYDVKFVEDAALKSLTIAGVDAVQDKEDPTAWTLTIDPTKLTSSSATPIKVSAGKVVADTEFALQATQGTAGSASWAGPAHGTRVEYDFRGYRSGSSGPLKSDEDTKYDLWIKDVNGNVADYVVTLKHVKSTETEIKTLKATVAGYEEVATISGNTINLVVSNTATVTNNTISATALSFTTSTGAAVTLNEAGSAFVSGSAATLNVGNNSLDVVAQDEKTTTRYILNVSKAPATVDTGAVTKAVMTVGTDKYEGDITNTSSVHEIVFEVPASASSAKKTAVGTALKNLLTSASNPASFTWETTAHTKVNNAGAATVLTSTYNKYWYKHEKTAASADGQTPAVYDYKQLESFFEQDYSSLELYTAKPSTTPGATENDLTNLVAVPNAVTAAEPGKVVNTISVVTDDGTSTDWTVIFKENDPRTGHSLTRLTFYGAGTKDEIAPENTFAAERGTGAFTVTNPLPYAYTHTINGVGPTDMVAEYAVSSGATLYYSVNGTSLVLANNGYDADTGANNGVVAANILLTYKYLVVVSEQGTTRQTPVNTTNTLAGLKADSDVTVYDLSVKDEASSDAKDIISLGTADGKVSSEIDPAAGTVVLTVPTDYVVKGSETYFDLVIELSPLVQGISPDLFNDGISENAQVKGNDEDGYKLYLGGTAYSIFDITAQDGSHKKYTLTVKAAELDDDNTLSGITVKGTAAKAGEDNAWTVELPYGTDLAELTTEDIEAAVAEKATATVAAGEEEGTFTITVKAENGQTADYTLTVTVADEPENPFTDIGDPEDPNNWYASSVVTAVGKGWVTGMGDGKFDPTGSMRRGDFALIIARILAGGETEWNAIKADYAKDVFTDVKEGLWYYEAVAYVVDEGIMDGRGAGIFDPMGTITRQEAAKVMAIASGLEEVPGNTVYADDASIAGWAKPFVNACTKEGIFQGAGDSFNPTQKLTRAMGATILVRAFDKAEEPEVPAE